MSLLIDEVVSVQSPAQGFAIILRDDELAVIEDNRSEAKASNFSCLIPKDWLELDQAHVISVGTLYGQRIVLIDITQDARIERLLSASLPGPSIAFTSLRAFFSTACAREANIASRAAQLSTWRKTHKFCSSCGAPTQIALDDRAYVCTSCGFRMYPRIAPCVIGIVRKNSEILLAHGRNHTSNIYSAIAGFIEAGETPEEAFVREVKEEVGIDIHEPEYLQSQAWPFPGQLMIGFTAQYKSGDIQIDQKELVHAAWFKKDTLPALPPAFTISAKLIEHVLLQME